MKVSEMIAGLKSMQETYGDLEVWVSLALEKDIGEGQVVNSNELTFGYNQMNERKMKL